MTSVSHTTHTITSIVTTAEYKSVYRAKIEYQDEYDSQPRESTLFRTFDNGMLILYEELNSDDVVVHIQEPIEVGNTWAYKPNSSDFGFCEIESINETVTVAAGQFTDCLHIKYNLSNDNYSYDIWYAPGVGVVREEGSVWVLELTEYYLE